MKTAYPVIFTDTADNILIEVPDLKILSESNGADEPKAGLADAIASARDAIGIRCITLEEYGKEIPKVSASIYANAGTFSAEGQSFVSLVDVDTLVYRRKLDTRSVRRNVTLPNWLDREASAANINVSKVLQEALKVKLGISHA